MLSARGFDFDIVVVICLSESCGRHAVGTESELRVVVYLLYLAAVFVGHKFDVLVELFDDYVGLYGSLGEHTYENDGIEC